MPTLTTLEPKQLRDGVVLLVDFPELGGPLLFSHPREQWVACHITEIPELLHTVETAALAGHWVAGFLTYEAAGAFGLPVFAPRIDPSTLPLAWFALFPPPQTGVYPALDPFATRPFDPPTPTLSCEHYRQNVLTIAQKIACGETYQVNYTVESHLTPPMDPALLFLQLQMAHRFPRAVWIHHPNWEVASWSPETFLERWGTTVITAPIKGTRPRGTHPSRDIELACALESSTKDRAEHVMIVDMARNDLGKICQTGSVTVAPLMARRSFSTLHHLESRVQGCLNPKVGLAHIMEALFPAASITGAPKHRTMEIIRELEGRIRGIYTGSMGVIQPGGNCLFNVAIRTMVRTLSTKCSVGLGGGVVADSDPDGEWMEIFDKGRFLTEVPPLFGLIETFLVDQTGQVTWLERHLTRMAGSALTLGFPWDQSKANSLIQETVNQWVAEGTLPRVGRLLLTMQGQMTLSSRLLQPWPKSLKIRLADWRPDPLDMLSRHKTTRRDHYDFALTSAQQNGYDEVLLVSVLDKVLEGAMSALLVKIDGCWYVPPVEDGLLPSLWRETEMIRRGALVRSLTLEDLARAEEIIMGNAVRGGAGVERLEDTQGRVIYSNIYNNN
ncbi:MAG: bifunctional anthranilate synthase component I family protein/class IV aminotransferase [Magnetococcus sp. YQC-5]